MVVELIPGGVDSACHPSEVVKMSASLLVSCVGVVTRPGLCPIAKETAFRQHQCSAQSTIPMDGWETSPEVKSSAGAYNSDHIGTAD